MNRLKNNITIFRSRDQAKDSECEQNQINSKITQLEAELESVNELHKMKLNDLIQLTESKNRSREEFYKYQLLCKQLRDQIG